MRTFSTILGIFLALGVIYGQKSIKVDITQSDIVFFTYNGLEYVLSDSEIGFKALDFRILGKNKVSLHSYCEGDVYSVGDREYVVKFVDGVLFSALKPLYKGVGCERAKKAPKK